MAPKFFASPQQAVEEIGRLLSARDWPALSRCYDLSGTSVAPADLESGAFFLAEGDPHPALLRGPVRPFSPGFQYASHEIAGNDAVVTVSISIDQGDGMIQRGFSQFRMRRSTSGWQLRPGTEEKA